MTTERENRLEELLAQFLKPVRGVPYEVVIRALYDMRVEAFGRESPANRKTLADIEAAAKRACRNVQENPIRRPRPNEVGNDMEPFVMQALQGRGLRAEQPKTKAGKGKSTGYPDMRIDRDGLLPIYLEVKTYARKNRGTTQRSFFLSPSDDLKVTDAAHHLLVGFEIERKGNLYRPVAYEIVDLFGLECDVKAEFNSDNRRLYDERRTLAKGRVPYEGDNEEA